MAKQKKNRQADFQKVKLKVGKRLKKADNVTNASFKTRTIQISQQLKSKDGSEPSTKRKQNISELLTQCRHYSISVRHEAVTGLRELLISFPELAASHLAVIIEKSFELLTDKDAAVRQGVIRLFKVFFPKVSEKQISPFFPLLCAHLCCAMTHIYEDIQVHSLSILDLLLEHYPKLMISKSNKVLSNFIEQISRQQGQGQMKRSLVTNPNSKTSTLKWRSSVLNRLEKFLSAILQFHTEMPGVAMEMSHLLEVTVTSEKIVSVQSFPKGFRQQWETPGFTISSSAIDQAPEQGDVFGGKFQEFASTLVPLLLECWVESAPSQQMSSGAGNLVPAESVELMSSILHVTQLLWECITLLLNEQQQKLWQKEKYLKDFQHHFLANFPYSVHTLLVKKDKKDKQSEQASAEALNLAICDIMTHFISDVTSQNRNKILARLPIITQYLHDFLSGKYGNNMIGQSCRTVVKILDRLMHSGICDGSLSDIIMVAFHRFKGANCMSQEKKTYLKFFADIMVDSWDPALVSSEVREQFLKSLPELLPLVARENSQMATLLIDTMKKAACQKCAIFLEREVFEKKRKEWFDPVHGALVSLSPQEQRNLLGLLYFMPDIGVDLIKALTSLVRSEKLGESEAAFLVQVLHNRSLSWHRVCKRGNVSIINGVATIEVAATLQFCRYLRLGQRSEDAAIHLGFLSNIVLGLSKEEISLIVDQSGCPDESITCGGFRIINNEQTDTALTLVRHRFLIQVVCSVISQCTNSEQILAVICNFIHSFLNSHTVPLQVVYGICSFAESLSSVPSNVISSLTTLSISLVLQTVTWEESGNQEIMKTVQDLGCSLILKIPTGAENLLKEILHQLTDTSHEHLNAVLRTVLLFLIEGRSQSINAKPECLELLDTVLDTVKTTMKTDGNENKETVSMETVKLVTEFEYLVSMLT